MLLLNYSTLGLRSRLRNRLRSHLLIRRKVLPLPYQETFFEIRRFFRRWPRILREPSPGDSEKKKSKVGCGGSEHSEQ